MKTIRTPLIIAFLIDCLTLIGQEIPTVYQNDLSDLVTNNRGKGIVSNEAAEEKSNSIILFTNWVKGAITLQEGNEIQDIALNYDMSRNCLLINKGSTQVILPAERVKSFIITPTESKFIRLKLLDKLVYMEEIVKGKVSLMKFREIEINKTKDVGGYVLEEGSAELTYEYYFKTEDQLVKIVSPKKLLKRLPGYQEELRSYFSDNTIDFKNEEDLIELTNFLNSSN